MGRGKAAPHLFLTGFDALKRCRLMTKSHVVRYAKC